jgi:hypothetical protein
MYVGEVTLKKLSPEVKIYQGCAATCPTPVTSTASLTEPPNLELGDGVRNGRQSGGAREARGCHEKQLHLNVNAMMN